MPTPAEQCLTELLPHFRTAHWSRAVEHLAQELDSLPWAELKRVATRHRLGTYLAYTVRQIESVDAFIRTDTEETLSRAKAQYVKQTVFTEEIAETLRDLRFCFLRGITLASDSAPLPYLRSMGDIDLWVARSHFLEAIRLLLAEGFQISRSDALRWPPRPWLQMHGLPTKLDIEVVLVRGSVFVELHPCILSSKLPQQIDEESVLEQLDSHSFEPAAPSLPVLQPDALWIHLACQHAVHIFSRGLGSLLDLALWEQRHPLSLSAIEEQIERWGLSYLALPALAQLREIFPDLPSVRHFSTRIPSPPDIFTHARIAPAPVPTPWYWIRRGPTPMRSLFKNLFPGRSVAAILYDRNPDDPLLWLPRMARPFQLVRRHLRAFTRESFRS